MQILNIYAFLCHTCIGRHSELRSKRYIHDSNLEKSKKVLNSNAHAMEKTQLLLLETALSIIDSAFLGIRTQSKENCIHHLVMNMNTW